jgi:hypothetical protein
MTQNEKLIGHSHISCYKLRGRRYVTWEPIDIQETRNADKNVNPRTETSNIHTMINAVCMCVTYRNGWCAQWSTI